MLVPQAFDDNDDNGLALGQRLATTVRLDV